MLVIAYVVDRNNHRVQKFNSDGIYQSQFGSNGNGNSQFSSPIGIEFDSGGNIFVTDTGNNRIQKFDPSGNFLNKFGSSGTGDGQFDNVNGITTNSTHTLVTDMNNDRVQIFGDEGVDFGAARTFGASADFQSAIQKFVGQNVFATGAKFSDGQDFSSLAVQTFQGANTFGNGTKFASGQDLSAGKHTFGKNIEFNGNLSLIHI